MAGDIWADVTGMEKALAPLPGSTPILEIGSDIADPEQRLKFYDEMIKEMSSISDQHTRERFPPVDAATFLDDPYFFGDTMKLWPAIRTEVIEACSGKYIEAVFTGSIGTGKTTAALAVKSYFLYRTLNLRDPHKEFELDSNSEIAFILQSITGGTAFTVDYMRFRRAVEKSPWFQDNAEFDQNLKATIQFKDRNIVIQPLPGTETAAIGENVMGGIIDEVNHMKVIQGSSRVRDGGSWDQMLENYRAIARRRESRFQRAGNIPGMLCLIGSANYAGQFTDRKKAERDAQLLEDGTTSIYMYDKRPWEVQPPDRFSKTRFKVFLGDGTRKPRVLADGEKPSAADAPFIMDVPTDYRNAFRSDLPGAVKDIAGIALHGFSNFIPNIEAITKAFGTRKNIFEPDWCDFNTQPAKIIGHTIPNPEASRYVHIDLALSMDNASLAMGHCAGFGTVDRGGGMKDILPRIVMDALLTIKPSSGSQIPIYKIKKLVFALRNMGYKIEWVSLDGFQSADFIQTMRRNGMKSGVVSMDRTPEPYMTTKQLILDGFIDGPDHELIRNELKGLSWVSQNTKVDHPPDGCFMGDTLILRSDGTYIRFDEMLGRHTEIITFTGTEFVPAKAENPRVTKYTTDLVCVELDDGSEFTCTPEHKFLLVTGEWVPAGMLQDGDDILSLHN